MVKNFKKYYIKILTTFALAILLVFGCFFVIKNNEAVTFASATSTSPTISNVLLDTTDYYRESYITNGGIKHESADSNFAFTSGASVLKNDLETMVFRIKLVNVNFENIKTQGKYLYSFSLFQCSEDGVSATEMCTYMICIDRNKVGCLGFQNKTYFDEEFNIIGYSSGSCVDSNAKFEIQARGFTPISTFSVNNWSLNFVDETQQYLYLTLKTSSDYTRYFIRYSYSFHETYSYKYGGFLGIGRKTAITEREDPYASGNIDSSFVSVYDVLKNMKDKHGLESQLDETGVANATAILEDNTYKLVQIRYLKQIADTPFATYKTAYVKVPVIEQVIEPEDVASYFGLSSFGVLQSHCSSFVYNESEDVYEAYYLKSVYFSAKDVNGNDYPYYLDCNKSYQSFYKPFVDKGLFSNDIYEYMLNKIYLKFPVIRGYDADEIFGYYGYAATPNTYTFNDLWAEMFGKSPNFVGTVDHHTWTSTMKLSAYNALLEDGQYGFFGRIWNDFAGLVSGGTWSADHHLFYVDSGITEAFIAENGATSIDDDGSLIRNNVADVIENVGDWFGETFGGDSTLSKFIKIVGAIFVAMLVVTLLDKIIRLFQRPYHSSKNKSGRYRR